MSDKMTCPICDSYTSSVHWAVSQGEPCPYCGTSAVLIEQINELRDRHGDNQLKTELEIALIDLDSATRQRDRLARLLLTMRQEIIAPDVMGLLDEIRNRPTP